MQRSQSREIAVEAHALLDIGSYPQQTRLLTREFSSRPNASSSRVGLSASIRTSSTLLFLYRDAEKPRCSCSSCRLSLCIGIVRGDFLNHKLLHTSPIWERRSQASTLKVFLFHPLETQETRNTTKVSIPASNQQLAFLTTSSRHILNTRLTMTSPSLWFACARILLLHWLAEMIAHVLHGRVT